MSEIFPKNVFNHDVIHLYDYLSRFYIELSKSQSAPVSGMISADQARLEKYIASINAMIKFVQSTPELDMPETHPRPYTLEPFPLEVNVENESINYLLRLVRASAVELTNSQSARFASRLQPFDEKRCTSLIQKCSDYLNTIIRKDVVPIDLPESSPEEALTGDGITGVTGPVKAN